MDIHNSASSPNSNSSLSSNQPSHTPSTFSNFPDSEYFRRLPTILQSYITPSSAPISRELDGSSGPSLDLEDDPFDSLQLPSFADIPGFDDSTSSSFNLDNFQQTQTFSDFVDLSSDSDQPTMAPRRAPKRAAEASSSTSPHKRAKRDEAPKLVHNADKSIEEVDLVEEDTALADTLKKQRQQQVASQEDLQKPTKLSKISCIICMDTPTDLTATICGHVFCFECLTQALAFGDRSGGDGRRGNCPVCRKAISRVKKGDIIPLEIMKKGLATQPTKA